MLMKKRMTYGELYSVWGVSKKGLELLRLEEAR